MWRDTFVHSLSHNEETNFFANDVRSARKFENFGPSVTSKSKDAPFLGRGARLQFPIVPLRDPRGPNFSNFRWPEATENSKISGRAPAFAPIFQILVAGKPPKSTKSAPSNTSKSKSCKTLTKSFRRHYQAGQDSELACPVPTYCGIR